MQFEGISSGMDDYGSGFGVTAEPTQQLVDLGDKDSWVSCPAVVPFHESYLNNLHHAQDKVVYKFLHWCVCTTAVVLVAQLLHADNRTNVCR